MLYGNLKNCTYTQSSLNCNAGVGFFIALIYRNFYPNGLSTDWYFYLLGIIIFLIPGIIPTYRQLKTGLSLEQIELKRRPFRIWL